METQKILFICRTNLIFSPAAQAIMNKIIRDNGVTDFYSADSAGTEPIFEGEYPDLTMMKKAADFGYLLTHRTRRFSRYDLDSFHYIIPIGAQIFERVYAISNEDTTQAKIYPGGDFMAGYAPAELNQEIFNEGNALHALKKVFIENGTEVLIEDLTFGGKAICRQDGLVIMIDGALPGQRVRINIKSRRRRYAEAVVTEVLARSPYETEVPYQDTPGAPWIRLKPEYQRKYKQMQIYDLFRKTAHTDAEAVFDEYIESPLLYGYRNKMEYSFGYTQEAFDSEEKKFSRSGFGLGSRKRGILSWWKIWIARPGFLMSILKRSCRASASFVCKAGFRHMILKKISASTAICVSAGVSVKISLSLPSTPTRIIQISSGMSSF
ncbi:hypothetical protein CHS0354_013141 [Potamilus streckersoni]|uniref:TRAM domain-containing protein n=1 Tax=Potamilus streckersoni TaxID=2493646 RepID=A0AAE0S6C9_9BIVA|nr:hypothetical protein CHS0354_013141 [Potamilus streckersoni]